MALSSDSVLRMLPQSYTESRSIEKIRDAWTPAVRQEMRKHLDLVKEGVKAFSRAHDELLSSISRSALEKDETAELIIRQVTDDMIPGALDLISQIDQLVGQYTGQVAPEAVMICDDDDSRSLTMGLEPGSSIRRQGESSMGPPPRPAVLLTPVTPSAPIDNAEEGDHERTPTRDDREFVPSSTSHGSLALPQTAKRSLEVVDIDDPRAPEPPTKRAMGSTAPRLDGLVTGSVDFREVEGKHFIFKDKRYGAGRFVLRCGPNQREPFLQHPLRSNVAINHFASKVHSCHDTERTYTLVDLLKEFTCRGKWAPSGCEDPATVLANTSARQVQDPHGEVTELRVRSANGRLRQEYGAPKGSGKKPRKGKERASTARSAAAAAAASSRPGTAESSESYQDEVSTEAQAPGRRSICAAR